MISNVMVIGEMDEVISENTRYIKVIRPYRDSNGKVMEDRFPIRYWSRATNTYFMMMKYGTLIGIRGRLEYVKDLGVVIMCDFLEPLHLPLTIKDSHQSENLVK
jgi:hypothetical protein